MRIPTLPLSPHAVLTALLGLLAGIVNPAVTAQPLSSLLGSACTPALDQPVTESRTGRTYVLDFPCDLQTGEPVTLILNLHGGGSNTRYQHAYFPAHELKEKYRLVIATPFSPIRRWTEDDDAYLRNIVTDVTAAVGAENVRAFWLVGHSQGGMTSRRLVCTDFFAARVDGFVSLSGGRLGGAAPRAADAGRPRQNGDPEPTPAPAAQTPVATLPAADPGCDFSHVFAIGEHEIQTLPTTSTWAERLGCEARVQRPDVIDTLPGGTHDSGHQNPATKAWGRLPRPGTAQVFVYPNCDGGRVVADVVRLDKGHTEGLEPRIVEEIVTMMTGAAGGKLQYLR